MRLVGPVRLYCHSNTHYDVRDRYVKAGWDETALTQLETFLETRPLYEVEFEFYLDLDAGEAHCTKVDLGDGAPFRRDCPGQQLILF